MDNAATRHTVTFWGTVALLGLHASYGLWWAGADVIIRLRPDLRGLFGPRTIDFILQLGWVQEAIFFASASLVPVSLVLLLFRSAWALACFTVAAALIRTDWILSVIGGHDIVTLSGYVGLIFEAAVILLLIRLYQTDELRWRRTRGR